MTNASATTAQINTIEGLLERKDWNNDKLVPAKFISRAAVIRLAISIATGENAETWGSVFDHIATAEDLGERVNQVLAYSAESAEPHQLFAWAPLTKVGASRMIEWAINLRAKASQPTVSEIRSATAELEDGIYRNPAGQYVKVYKTQKGYQVAKVAHIESIPGNEGAASDTWAVTWNYVGKAGLAPLKPEMKLTLQEAADFGHIYGSCCICSRELTDELSIALGIGPVCGKREFGGEFTTIMKAKKEELKG